MCRWLAYSGTPILIDHVLFRPQNSLIDQSLSARRAFTPTNADGFGLGWYGRQETPGLFRSIRPAWNDLNLRDLSSHVESSLFLAHVRAASASPVQETNCHPFRHGRWLFVHNGEIREIGRIRRELLFAVAPEYFESIAGTTDSEIMFHLMLSLGLDRDPLGAAARMAGLVESVADRAKIENPLWMTLGFTDGVRVYGVRYTREGEAPSLCHTREPKDLRGVCPALALAAPHCRILASEPLGDLPKAWHFIPNCSAVVIEGERVDAYPFEPDPPPA